MKKKVSKKSKRRLMTFGILSIISIGYFFVTFFGYTYNYINLKKDESLLQSQLLSIQDKKADLKTEIQKLNDPDYVARYAKEKYLYSSDGEYVIKLDDDSSEVEHESNNNNIFAIIIVGSIIFLFIIFILRIKIILNHNKKKYKLKKAN